MVVTLVKRTLSPLVKTELLILYGLVMLVLGASGHYGWDFWQSKQVGDLALEKQAINAADDEGVFDRDGLPATYFPATLPEEGEAGIAADFEAPWQPPEEVENSTPALTPESIVASWAPPSAPATRITVAKGDTLIALLVKQGVSSKQAYLIGAALANVFEVAQLRPGQTITLYQRDSVFAAMVIETKKAEYVVYVTADGRLHAEAHRMDATTGSAKGDALLGYAQMPLSNPMHGSIISSPFGLRVHPIHGRKHRHLGVDFAAPSGFPVLAVADARVQAVGEDEGYGTRVLLRHNDTLHTLYGHLQAAAKGLAPGVVVQQGQVIGYNGNSGYSTAPHLHYEVRLDSEPVDPLQHRYPWKIHF